MLFRGGGGPLIGWFKRAPWWRTGVKNRYYLQKSVPDLELAKRLYFSFLPC